MSWKNSMLSTIQNKTKNNENMREKKVSYPYPIGYKKRRMCSSNG